MENTTKLTKEMYSSFLRRHSRISFIIIRICYVIIFLSGITSLTIGLVYGDIDLSNVIYCFTMGLLFVLYDIFYIKLNLSLVKNKNLIDCEYSFKFNETDLELTLKKDANVLASEKLNYNLIYKVLFYDDCIYVYVNRINAYIIEKNGFNTVEDYKKTLQILLPFANKNKKRK